jgi:beta-glucanase (GH16 family)
LTFDEKFNDLSVSAWGPGTCWIAHKPDHLDFGDARFTDPSANFPFTIRDGILRIEAKKDADGWKSGILSSCDAKGNGFAQLYGYFEMRAKFPKGPGTWPAFWMLSRDHLLNPKVPDVEYDIVEQYGQWPDIIHTVLHLWIPGNHVGIGEQHRVADTTADFHRYGLLWDATQIVWYFDGVELMRQPTPPEAHRPMYLLLDLALGAGWPIDHTPNPSLMLVDYLRAYATDDSARAGNQPTPHTDPIPDHRK